MCKKLGVTALVLVASLFVLHKLDLLNYGKVAWNRTKADLKQQIPPEVKIERLREEIAKLGPEERKARSVIASEMVEVKRLEKQIDETRVNLEKREVQLKDLRTDLEKGTAFVTLDNQKIPREQVASSLARKWDSFKGAKESLKSQEDLLKARKEALEAAKAKLDVMQDKKKEMLAKVEKMEIELRKLRTAQAQNNIAVDDSQLSNVMNLADEIEKQIQVQTTELSLQKGVDTDTAVEEALARKAKTDQAMKEMDEFFGGAHKVAAEKK